MSRWAESEAREAVRGAMGDRPEWFDGVTYGAAVRLGRAILDLRERAEKAEARCAALEAALRDGIQGMKHWAAMEDHEIPPCAFGQFKSMEAILALSGDTSALRAMLEKAADMGFDAASGETPYMDGVDTSAAIATRVLEGK